MILLVNWIQVNLIHIFRRVTNLINIWHHYHMCQYSICGIKGEDLVNLCELN